MIRCFHCLPPVQQRLCVQYTVPPYLLRPFGLGGTVAVGILVKGRVGAIPGGHKLLSVRFEKSAVKNN